jgi:hypothetical protein
MAVREFDGIDDTIVHAVDVLSSMTFGATAAIFKPVTTTASVWIGTLHTSGNAIRALNLGYNTSSGIDRCLMHAGSDSNSATDSFVNGNWTLAVVRKATGTAAPRFSVYDFGGATWVHSDGSVSLADWTATGAGGLIRTDVEAAFELLAGRLAVRAMWSNEVHWTADASGDAAIEAAGLEVALSNWVDEAPAALWVFNQASVATAVDDLINNCDQTSLTGTTVVTGDDPPGFSFDLGGGPPVLEEGPQQVIRRSNLRLG